VASSAKKIAARIAGRTATLPSVSKPAAAWSSPENHLRRQLIRPFPPAHAGWAAGNTLLRVLLRIWDFVGQRACSRSGKPREQARCLP
jgi:hypothetical protein